MATKASDAAPVRKTSAPSLNPLDLYNVRAQLSEEEQMVQDTVGRMVDEKVIPIIGRCFEEHRFPREIVRELAELGLLGVYLKGYGCAGLNAVSYGLICQELERGDSGIRSFVSVQTSLCMYPIYTYGSEAQKQKFLPGMAKGEMIGCFGLTEPHGGSDPANMRTHARRKGKDWVLNGAKMWITNGSIADVAVVWASTDEGIRGFLVEKGMKGFDAPEIERKFSLRASVTSSLFFDNVVVPEENLLPGVVGLKGPLSCLNAGALWHLVGCDRRRPGLPRRRSSTTRRAACCSAGRVAHTQAIQIRLADHARRITTAQLLSLHLGRLKDKGEMAPTQVSLAKWNNVRMALDVARDCRDMLGGVGNQRRSTCRSGTCSTSKA